MSYNTIMHKRPIVRSVKSSRTAGGSAGDPLALAAQGIEGQPLFGELVQDPQVRAGLHRAFRISRRRPHISRRVRRTTTITGIRGSGCTPRRTCTSGSPAISARTAKRCSLTSHGPTTLDTFRRTSRGLGLPAADRRRRELSRGQLVTASASSSSQPLSFFGAVAYAHAYFVVVSPRVATDNLFPCPPVRRNIAVLVGTSGGSRQPLDMNSGGGHTDNDVYMT